MVKSASKFAEALRAAKAAVSPEEVAKVQTTFIANIKEKDKRTLDTSILKLTKTGSTRLYIIIGVFLLIIIYLEGSLFKKVLTKKWYK